MNDATIMAPVTFLNGSTGGACGRWGAVEVHHVVKRAVITIAKIEAGSTRNVIPETARMLGTIRTVSERTRERVLEGVERLVKGA